MSIDYFQKMKAKEDGLFTTWIPAGSGAASLGSGVCQNRKGTPHCWRFSVWMKITGVEHILRFVSS